MTLEELKQKALSLPYAPGVYIMRDQSDCVIYVGKAKKLKNRVSQYFHDTASHNAKTRRMVSQIDHFDTIAAGSEFEALVLECSLIKHYMPKYNILLKDGKGYPYLCVDRSLPYPQMTLANRAENDGKEYFGPYGGRFLTQKLMDTLRLTFRLPGCSLRFPGDLGKNRPCLNYHIGNCAGWCRGEPDAEAYREAYRQIAELLRGKQKAVLAELSRKRDEAAEQLRFEEAAVYRDRIKAVEALAQKQNVIHGYAAQTDAIGYYENESKCAVAVLHFVGGDLLDKEYRVFPVDEDREELLSAFLKQYYFGDVSSPKVVLLPFSVEDIPLMEQWILENRQRKTHFRIPQRGDGLKQLALANENAMRETERVTSKEEKLGGAVSLLGKLLHLPAGAHRLEAYDISHTAGKDIVASMTVFIDGKPRKKEYRLFKMRGLDDQDDYASMKQTILRRFTHYLQKDAGFSELPDALLIDGGTGQVASVLEGLGELKLTVPTFGMVKDDRHRTRALVTPDGEELGISNVPALFALVGSIQEETHRFAVSYHRKLQSRHLEESALDKIPGIGEKRKSALLNKFHSVKKIKEASVTELQSVLPCKTAEELYTYFHSQESLK